MILCVDNNNLGGLLYEVNVLGTRNVVNACLETGVKRLVYTSSIHALKKPPHGTPIDEICPFEPQYSRGGMINLKQWLLLK